MTEVAITLGGRSYTVRPLTIAQLRVVMPGFLKASGGTVEGVDAMVDIVQAALCRDNPTVTRDFILGVESDIGELRAAVTAIGRLSGLIEKDPAEGEAKAAASTGAV